MNIFIKISLLVLLLISIIRVDAQTFTPETISNGGDTYVVDGINYSYTIGELSIETYEGENSNFTQGFHQTEYLLSSIKELSNIHFSLYPNPTSSCVIIRIDDFIDSKYIWKVFDINGKQIEEGDIIKSETTIDLTQFSPSTYLVHIIDLENNVSSVNKIQKTSN